MIFKKPPFTKESAMAKVKDTQDVWNTCNPDLVSQAYSVNSEWRNRTAFFKGKKSIKEFLTRKWEKEQEYRLKKELWSFSGNQISVRIEYEWRDANSGQCYRTHGNEHWEFDKEGLITTRDMSGNDIPIIESDRRLLQEMELTQ